MTWASITVFVNIVFYFRGDGMKIRELTSEEAKEFEKFVDYELKSLSEIYDNPDEYRPDVEKKGDADEKDI